MIEKFWVTFYFILFLILHKPLAILSCYSVNVIWFQMLLMYFSFNIPKGCFNCCSIFSVFCSKAKKKLDGHHSQNPLFYQKLQFSHSFFPFCQNENENFLKYSSFKNFKRCWFKIWITLYFFTSVKIYLAFVFILSNLLQFANLQIAGEWKLVKKENFKTRNHLEVNYCIKLL